MDTDHFTTLVQRLSKRVKDKGPSFSTAAAHILSDIASFPDGVTEPLLLSSMVASRYRKANRATSRHVTAALVVEVRITSCGARMLQLSAIDDGGQKFVTPLDRRLQGAASLLLPGRRLRLTHSATVETSTTGDGGTLLLLPTPHSVVVLDNTNAADLALIQKAQSTRVRGQAAAPELMVLRATSITEAEVYDNRELRRVLLELDGELACSSPREVEVELLLWDTESLIFEALIGPGSLVGIHKAALLTSGDAELGGSAAQIGLEHEETVLFVVDEHANDDPAKRPRTDPPAAEEASRHGEVRVGWLATAPLLSRDASPPSILAKHLPTAAAATAATACASVELPMMRDARGDCRVLLYDFGDGTEAARVHRALRGGHHAVVTSLKPCVGPAPSGAPEQKQDGNATSPMTTLCGLLHDGGGGNHASVYNLSTLACTLRSPPPISVAPMPLAALLREDPKPLLSGVVIAKVVGWRLEDVSAINTSASNATIESDHAAGRLLANRIRISLSDDKNKTQAHCAVAYEALPDAMGGVTAEELVALEDEEEREECITTALLGHPARVWALTRELPQADGYCQGSEWCINATTAVRESI